MNGAGWFNPPWPSGWFPAGAAFALAVGLVAEEGASRSWRANPRFFFVVFFPPSSAPAAAFDLAGFFLPLAAAAGFSPAPLPDPLAAAGFLAPPAFVSTAIASSLSSSLDASISVRPFAFFLPVAGCFLPPSFPLFFPPAAFALAK